MASMGTTSTGTYTAKLTDGPLEGKTITAEFLESGDPRPRLEIKAESGGKHYLYTRGGGYAGIMVTRPQTLGYSLADSPAGLAAFFYDKIADWTFSGGDPLRSLTRDQILDDITLYWLTKTETSSAQLYYENNENNFNAVDVSLPAAVTVFPGEIYQAPRSWAERAYPKLIHYNQLPKGGHFAAFEQPEHLVDELRTAFRSLR